MIMMTKLLSLALAVLAVSSETDTGDVTQTARAAAPANELVVVELFTSQSCGKCPRANALLGEIAADTDVLALAYGINYWDEFYGWPDQFARPEFVDRQDEYVAAGEARRKFTPHFVINGSPELLRFRENRILNAVSDADPLPIAIDLEAMEDQISVSVSGAAPEAAATVWHVTYMAGPEEFEIDAGPNRGKPMNHFNMVRSIEMVAEWSGGDAVFSFDRPDVALTSAVLIQQGAGGQILSAARLN